MSIALLSTLAIVNSCSSRVFYIPQIPLLPPVVLQQDKVTKEFCMDEQSLRNLYERELLLKNHIMVINKKLEACSKQ